MKLSQETKVGILVGITAVLTIALAWLVGFQNPFRKTQTFYVTYQFAGGIDVGSPVRVSGIKVGRVEAIDFFSPTSPDISKKEAGSAESDAKDEWNPVRLKISVQDRAAVGIKKDSRFYINLAGIIGERYIEITPGTRSAERIQPGETVAGVDPPRLDQLISQSFNLAGKIIDVIEKNKGDIGKSIEQLYKLSENLNKLMASIDKSKIFNSSLSSLVENLNTIAMHVKLLTGKIDTVEGKKTLDLLHDLLWRLEPLNQEAIHKFFQKDGIRTHIF